MRISDWSSYVCSSDLIAFRPVLRPDRLATTMHAQADVRSTGVQMLDSVLGRLEREIAGEASVLESGFSLCDAYALVFAQWSRRPQVCTHIEPTPRLQSVARAVHARPAVADAARKRVVSGTRASARVDL